jgi:hypothetical protein
MDLQPESAQPMPQKSRRILEVVLAISPALALFLLHALRYGGWLIDDAGISFAYARNLAVGAGFVAQEGLEPVEGFSNPLWTLLVAALTFLKLFSIPLLPKVLSCLLVLGSFVAFTAAMLQVLPRIEALIVAALGLLLAAANPGFVIWCVSGLENPLLALLAACLLLVSLRAMQAAETALDRLCIQAGVIAAGLALTRPDALLYAAMLPLACLLRPLPLAAARLRRCALFYGVALAIPLGGYTLFRRLYFNDWLPNTYYAKPGVSLAPLREVLDLTGYGPARLGDLAHGIFPVISVIALIAPVAAAVWAALAWRQEIARKTLLIAAFVALAYATYLMLPQDWMGEYRFATIAFPCTYLLVFLLLQQLLSSSRLISAKRAFLVLAGLGLFVVSAPALNIRSITFAARPVVPLETVATGASLYNDLAAALKLQNSSLLIPDLGGNLLLSRSRIVDVAGLCDRQFGRLYANGSPPAVFAEHILRNVKPDVVHIHLYWAERSGLPESAEFLATYVDLGDGDYVRRDSLPTGISDEAARSIKAQLVKTRSLADVRRDLDNAMRLAPVPAGVDRRLTDNTKVIERALRN